MVDIPGGIFITGTDTGVGKTVVTAALASCLQNNGYRVGVLKPVQTGTRLPGMTDIQFVYKTLQKPYRLDDVCFYRMPEPLSPMTASELANTQIDVGYITESFRRFSVQFDVVIVEGAGGILVPIKQDYFMLDLAAELGLSTIIVSRPGLGTINHTLLTAKAVMDSDTDLLGFVISSFPRDPDTAEKTNPEIIESIGKFDLLGVIPFLQGLSVEQGITGNLKDISGAFFVPEFGGSFDKNGFFKELGSR